VISVPIGAARFNYRTAAAIIHDEHVLLHRALYEDFWALPGGRVEILENSRDALARELVEELGPAVNVRIERLLWVVENFFTDEGTAHHELGMYYLARLDEPSAYLAKDRDYFGIEKDLSLQNTPIKLLFRWFPLSELAQARLYPAFLRTQLTDLPAFPEHLVHVDTDE